MTDSDLVILDHVAETNSAVRRLLADHAALKAELLRQCDRAGELERGLTSACDWADCRSECAADDEQIDKWRAIAAARATCSAQRPEGPR